MALVYPTSLSQGTTANATDVQGMFDAITTLLNTTKLDNSYIVAGTLTNTQISSTASVALSKLAAGSAAGQLIVTAASTYVPTYVTPSGDVTPDSTGAFTIGNLKVTNAMLAGSIAYSKLSLTGAILNADLAGSIVYSKLSLANGDVPVAKLVAGTSAQVLLNSSAPLPTWTTLSGDVTVGATGTTAIGAGKVLNTMIGASALYGDYQAITSSFGTSNTSATQVTGLTSTVTIPSGRKAKITVYTNGLQNAAAGQGTSLTLWKGTVGSGTQLQQATATSSTVNAQVPTTLVYIDSVSTGSTTYNAAIHASGNASTLTASSTAPAFILVEWL